MKSRIVKRVLQKKCSMILTFVFYQFQWSSYWAEKKLRMFLGNRVQSGWFELKQGQYALCQGLILGWGQEGKEKEEV